MKKALLLLFALFTVFATKAQFDLNSIKDKAKQKVNEKIDDKLDKKQKEFDETNFNYAILFLDNSASFEAEEKGLALSSNIKNTSKFIQKEEKNVEERAYTNLRNGELLYNANRYYLAEQSFKLAKFIYEEGGYKSSGNYAQTIGDLALLYQSRGMYTKAKDLSETALTLRNALDNKGMQIVAINNNAVLKKSTGLYPEAESDFKTALPLAEQRADHLAIALLYNNLAMTYVDMNKLAEAESYMDKCVTEGLQAMKEEESNYIKLLINKANVLRFRKKYTDAEQIYLKCIGIKEKKLGAHPDLAGLKLGLAQLYMDMGNTAAVEQLLQSAYDIYLKKLGEKNPATIATMQQQANYYRFAGNMTKASALIAKVISAKKLIYGETHPSYVQALEDQAITQWQNNQVAEAKESYKIVLASTLSYINTFFKSLNENEKNLYWEKTSQRLQAFYSFAAAVGKNDPSLQDLFYSTLVNTKGFLLNNSAKIKNSIFSSGDADLMENYRQWLQTKEALNLAYQLSREEQISEHVNLDSLKQRSGDLEKTLSQKSALFRESLGEQALSVSELQKELKAQEAIVEIVQVNEFKNGFTGNQNYFAFVVTNSAVKFIALGDGATIEKAVKDFRDKTIHTKPENEAYALLWKPLEDALTQSKRLFVSADGAYHKVSLAALKNAQGIYLADKFDFTLIGNSRDITTIHQTEKTNSKPVTAQLFGNPLYGKKGLVQQLDGTELEVQNISKLLKSLKVNTTATFGANATESAIKALQSPSILHIATHGYFLNDVSKREGNKVLGVDIKAANENPLLRSGLLLANCENVYDENYAPVLTAENGVLTAYEAMNLSLEKTDLVVLSACETGLGSIKQGEGVYGLQRAFLIAGAKSIIMSLWSVSDDATMELMTLFYGNYAKTGDTNASFNAAVKQLKTKYKQPFYWSAFVMLSH